MKCCFLIGILVCKTGVLIPYIVILGKEQNLGACAIAVRGGNRNLVRLCLDGLAVCQKLIPGLGNLKSQLLINCLIIEAACYIGGCQRNSVNGSGLVV